MKDDKNQRGLEDMKALGCNNNARNKTRRGKKKVKRNSNNDYLKSTQGYSTVSSRPIGKDGVDNDPKWYMNLDPIAKDYASLPFNQVLGLSSNPNRGTNTNFHTDSIYMPGLMTIYFDATIGMNETGPTAPVNLAAQQLYTLMRKNKSGTMKYDKTDVMMTIMAMDSAYMVYEDLLRAYRVISTYNGMNRYYPNGMIMALGFDQSVQYQLSRFRGIIDMFAYKLASVNIPDQLDILKRHSWMCSNIYLDEDNVKAQSYAFMLNSYYVWKEADASKPAYLQKTAYHDISTKPTFTLDQIETIIDDIMNPILGSEDIGLITGDILTAFGDAGMIKIQPVEDYAALVPVYSSEVSLQIRNIFSCIGKPVNTAGATGNIETVNSNLVSGPYLQQKFAFSAATSDWGSRLGVKPLLNFINEETNPENVMVATRLMTLCTPFASGGVSTVSIYGTENVVGMCIVKTTGSSPIIVQGVYDQDMTVVVGNTIGTTLQVNLDKICSVSCFKNAPTNYIFVRGDAVPVETYYVGQQADVCNYQYMDDEDLRHLHEIATMSLFTVKDYRLNDLR